MPIEDDLLEILCCPETRQPLTRADASVLDLLNDQIAAGNLRNRGGAPVDTPIEEALLREDGRVLYLLDDDIPIMLVDQSIELA